MWGQHDVCAGVHQTHAVPGAAITLHQAIRIGKLGNTKFVARKLSMDSAFQLARMLVVDSTPFMARTGFDG